MLSPNTGVPTVARCLIPHKQRGCTNAPHFVTDYSSRVNCRKQISSRRQTHWRHLVGCGNPCTAPKPSASTVDSASRVTIKTNCLACVEG